MNIAPLKDFAPAIALWNRCVQAGEVLYAPMDDNLFAQKFVHNAGCDPDLLLGAEIDGRLAGLIHGVAPGTFPGSRPEIGYLTVVLADPAWRGQGVGRALLQALSQRLKAKGAKKLMVSSLNPVNLSWRVPGTPGHDHNNMPGVDMGCAGVGFFPHMGFEKLHEEVAMYRSMADYQPPADLEARRAALRAQGIETGPYDWRTHCDFDGMCDRVGSDYWRDVLRTEIAAWEQGKSNADPRFFADDATPPKAPRTLLTATANGQIVGFTGPVDRQKSGRGWFTGICTDPNYGGKGIATVLFTLLMQAFANEGAAFSTLFTGTENHAQKIYLAAGMRPVRHFMLMSKSLEGND